MSTFDIGSPVWKQTAKKWRAGSNFYYSAYREELTNKYEYGTRWALAKATADRRKEWLRRCKDYLIAELEDWGDYGGDSDSYKSLTGLIDELAKELKDDND